MSKIFFSVDRVETKTDSGFESLRRDVAANSQTITGYSERFNFVNDKLESIRNEIQSRVGGRKAISFID